MLGGDGYYRGSSVLVTGTAGTGKTSLAAHFAYAACKRGERCLYLAFEESPSQMLRNMRSIGLDLEPFSRNGLLQMHASRPTLLGLETHLVQIHKMVHGARARCRRHRSDQQLHRERLGRRCSGDAAAADRLSEGERDHRRSSRISPRAAALEATDIGISSLIDTWLLLRDLEAGGERNRGLYVIKSRGMAHSNQVREFLITDDGVELRRSTSGRRACSPGSLRAAQEAREKAARSCASQDIERARRPRLERRRAATRAQILALEAELEAAENEAALVREHRTRRASGYCAEQRAATGEAPRRRDNAVRKQEN